MATKSIKVVFLGGVGEIGKNMTAIEYGEDIIVIDCGMSFPTTEMPGVDMVIPDCSYLKENVKRIRGFVITHGHEDHIGAIPLILKDINVPVYATKLTLALIEHKLIEQNLDRYTLKTVEYGSKIRLGCMEVEFIKVSHSITGAVALSITTPKGIIFHTGDYKIDFTPVDSTRMDLIELAKVGERGVLLMLGESTNVEREGYSMSERKVGEALDKIFAANIKKRIIIATFASNVNRLQQIIDLAKKYKRHVAMHGRSMENISEMAIKIGELKTKEEFIPINKIKDYPDERMIILCTGSQGEPMSALTKMTSDNSKIKITKNDTIIMYDAAYEAYIQDEDIPHSIYEIKGARKVAIEFHSYSKTAGFTGVRCGYTVIPKELSAATLDGTRIELNHLWDRRQSTKFNGTSYISQRAAEAIYTPEGKQQIKEVIDYYMTNAAIMHRALTNMGLEVFGGRNAPYLWVKTPNGMESWKFFEQLLYGASIVCTPGVGFGPSGEGYVRLTAFGNREDCEEAMRRMAEWMAK